MEKQKLIKVIEDLKEVRTATKSKVSDETLFDAGVRIYNSEQIETHRHGKKPFESPMQQPLSPATQGQLYKLKQLRFKGDTSKLTKKEASRLIDELK